MGVREESFAFPKMPLSNRPAEVWVNEMPGLKTPTQQERAWLPKESTTSLGLLECPVPQRKTVEPITNTQWSLYNRTPPTKPKQGVWGSGLINAYRRVAHPRQRQDSCPARGPFQFRLMLMCKWRLSPSWSPWIGFSPPPGPHSLSSFRSHLRNNHSEA